MGVATAATLIGTGMSVYQGVKGAKAGEEAADRSDAALARQREMWDKQIELGEENLQWFRGLFDDWQQEYQPILEELKAEAMSGVTPDYAAIAADTRKAFEGARESSRREMGRYGINPGDGQFGAEDRRFAISEAATEVGAREQARRAASDERFRKLAHVYGQGSAEKRTALSGVSNASGQFQGALAGVASGQGDQARMYGNAAAGGWDAALGQDWDGIIRGALGAFGGMGGNESPGGGGGGGGGGDTGWRPPGFVGDAGG